jgi:SAM-dependent methyltransferase
MESDVRTDELASDGDAILEEQKAYYRARAGEYDEWFLRQGRYDHGPEFRAQWDAEVGEVRRRLGEFRPAGRVLEIAAGTGWWTEQLLRYADHVTALDASAETLAVNRGRVGGERVSHVQADVFRWTPDAAYDVVFFGFWLSHVPPERFAGFWGRVRAALAPGGRVFFVDSLRTERSTARDHVLPAQNDPVMVRKLNDGRSFRIVKVFYDPARLQADLLALGWNVDVRATEQLFLHGAGAPAR